MYKLSLHSCNVNMFFLTHGSLALRHFHSIVHLSLAFSPHSAANGAPFIASSLGLIPSLQSLSIKGVVEVRGLDEVLSASLSLRSLSLFNTRLEQGKRLASPRLKHLRLSSTDSARPLPTLYASDFASLQTFEVRAAVI